MTAEPRCWGGGVSHPSQLTTGLVIKSVTTSPNLAGERMLFILQVSILSEQLFFYQHTSPSVTSDLHNPFLFKIHIAPLSNTPLSSHSPFLSTPFHTLYQGFSADLSFCNSYIRFKGFNTLHFVYRGNCSSLPVFWYSP